MGQQYINQPQIFKSYSLFEKGLSGEHVDTLSILTSSISSVDYIGDYFGSTKALNLSSVNIRTLIADTSGAVFCGTFLGKGEGLEVSYLPQQGDVNNFVFTNSAQMLLQVLSAQKVHSDYFGNTVFPVISSSAITTAIINGESVFNGIYYGEGRYLKGVDPNQAIYNNITSRISADPSFNTLTVTTPSNFTLVASGNKVGINTHTDLTQALTVSGSISASSFIYGDGFYLTNVSTGNRRFDYAIVGDESFSYSGTSLNSNVTVGQSAWKIVKIQYAIDGTVVGLSGITNAAWVEHLQPWVIYT